MYLIQNLWRKKSWFIVSLEMLKGRLPKLFAEVPEILIRVEVDN